MAKKVLVEFTWDCRRQGVMQGLFITTQAIRDAAINKHVYFGEALGKHSEVEGILEDNELRVRSKDQDLIEKLETIFGRSTISGYNPLDYIDE